MLRKTLYILALVSIFQLTSCLSLPDNSENSETKTKVDEKQAKSESKEETEVKKGENNENLENPETLSGSGTNNNNENKEVKEEAEEKKTIYKEEISTYFDKKKGMNVYESEYQGFRFRFYFPQEWEIGVEESEGEAKIEGTNDTIQTYTDVATITSSNIKYYQKNINIVQEGIRISIINLGDVGEQSLEYLRGDFGSIGELIEEKDIKIDGKDSAKIYTWEGSAFQEDPKIDQIFSKTVSNINKKGFAIKFMTGGDKRKENYNYFKKMLEKIEILDK